jgi:serine/threonine protein kinase
LSTDIALNVFIFHSKIKKKADDEAVFREVSVLRELIHVPGVVRLIDFFVQPDTFYVVQVYAQGGDVFDRLSQRATYTEKDAKDLCKRLLETMRDMHKRGFAHRDLKPENLLLKDTVDDALILVADFGFAKRVPEGGLTTRCGTPAFVAPEIVLGTPYTQAADMWSVGVCLFMLLGGYPPFQDAEHRGLFRKIRAADYVFHETYWEHVSIEAKQVVSNLLVVNPEHRMTAVEGINSNWLQMKDETLSNRDLSPSLSEIKKFHGKRKLKSAMHAIHWATSATFFHPETATFSQQVSAWDTAFASASADGMTHREAAKIGFRDIYELKTKIRKGSFATVWECVHKTTLEVYAVKVIKREGLKPADDEAVLNEVAILQSLVCKDIVQLVDFYEEKDYFFMVMEYMQGGDVFDKIVEKNHYTEKDARDLVIVLLKAVRFMHGRGIAHRDLKPQNLLLRVSLDKFHINCNMPIIFTLATPSNTLHSRLAHRTRLTMLISRSQISGLLVVYIHLNPSLRDVAHQHTLPQKF